jgi:hypothetical protein
MALYQTVLRTLIESELVLVHVKLNDGERNSFQCKAMRFYYIVREICMIKR